MPNLIPAEILELRGRQSTTAPIVLMEWRLPTPQYYSSRDTIEWNGHSWEGNRLKEFPSFTLGIFDRKGREFPKLDITLRNLANDGSALFPMQQLDAIQELENYEVYIYFYSPDAGTAFARWAGYSKRPTYKGEDKTVSLSCSFFFDSLNVPFPFRTQSDLGFGSLDKNQDTSDEPNIPLIWGDGPDLAVRPQIYYANTEGGALNVTIILTGCNDGLPLDANVITEAKYNGVTPATTIEMGGLGSAGQTAPGNLSRFPDGNAHPRVAFAFLSFPLPEELKDGNMDNLQADAVKLWMSNGRPFKSTGAPSENHALLVQDMLTDTYFSLGMPTANFDPDVLAESEEYFGERYRARLELHKSEPIMDLLQKILGDCHGYLTWADKVQLRAKRNDETAVATFATTNSGHDGRTIINNYIAEVTENDGSSLLNDLMFSYRGKNRHYKVPIHVYDPNKQSFTPGETNNPNREEIESLTLQYEDEASISAAIMVREEISGNLYHTFSAPFWDALADDDGYPLVPGRVIAVYSPDIFNNASNYLFRILTKDYDTTGCRVTFKCKVYKPAIYNDDPDGIGIDLLRGAGNTSGQGRPPDVVPVSVAVVDVDTNDPSGTLLTIEATATIPAHDPTDEQSKGIFREPPIAAWGCWHQRSDEPINQFHHGGTIEVQQGASAFNVSQRFDVQYHKNRTLRVFFVALPPSRAKSPLGYIRDTTKVSHLTAQLSATAITATVASETPFAINDFVIIEKEFDKVLSKAPLTFVNDGSGHRTPQMDSISILHPSGIEVAVAKKSYPSLSLQLAIRRTFLNVTGFAADQEDDGVRLHWDALQVDNLDYYLAYECRDADALSNAAKLGSTNPAWFATDPESPPAGITVHRTKHKHYKIPASDIAAGVVVAGRCAAKNTKGNYSGLLSNSATNNSTGHGVRPLFVPSDPTTGDIVSLGSVTEIAHKQVPIRLKIWAKASDHTKKFDDGGVDRVGFFYAPPQAGNPALPDLALVDKRHQNITDTSQVSSELVEWFPVGQKLFWLGNFNSNGSGKTLSANQAANVAFVPGGFSNDPANLTIFSITVTPVNDKFSKVDIHIVQPSVGSPVILKSLWFGRELPGESSYTDLDVIHLHGTTSYSQLAADFHLIKELKHPPGQTGINWRGLIIAQGDLSRSVTTASNSSTDPDVPLDTTAPTVPSAPTVIPSQAKIKVKTARPTTQLAQLVKCEIVARVKDGGGSVLGYIQDTATGPANSATEYKNDIGPHLKDTFFWKKAAILSLYATAATIEFYNHTTNEVGTSAASAATSLNVSTWEVDALAQDTAAPANLPTPKLSFKRGKLHAKLDMSAVTNVNGPYSVSLTINDGTNSLNLDDLNSNSVAAGIVFYPEGTETVVTIPISKQQLQTLFGSTGVLRCAFKITNAIGPTTSATSTTIGSLDTQSDYSPRTGYDQELWNGDMTNDDGVTATVLGNWQSYDPSSGTIATINTSNNKSRWDQANHLYFWRVNDATSTNKRYLIQNLFKTIVLGDYHSFSLFVSSDGTLTADLDVFLGALFPASGTVAIANGLKTLVGTGTAFLTELKIGSEIGVNGEIHVIDTISDNTHATFTIAASSTASGLTCFTATPQSQVVSITGRTYTTTPTYIELTLQANSDLYTAQNIYICFRTPTSITSSGPFLRVTRIMGVNGRTPVAFNRKALFERNTTSTGLTSGSPVASENFSFVPTGGGIGGLRQEPSGDPPAVGGYQAL